MLKKMGIIISSLALAATAQASNKGDISKGASASLEGSLGMVVDSFEIVSGSVTGSGEGVSEVVSNADTYLVMFSKNPLETSSKAVKWVVDGAGNVVQTSGLGENANKTTDGISQSVSGSVGASSYVVRNPGDAAEEAWESSKDVSGYVGEGIVAVVEASGQISRVVFVDVSADVVSTVSVDLKDAGIALSDGDISGSLDELVDSISNGWKAANPSGNYYEDTYGN